MRIAIPAVLVGLVALVLTQLGVRQPTGGEVPVAVAAAQPEVAPPPREQKPNPARDLKLVATFDAKAALINSFPNVVLTLVNSSDTFTYPVVRPSDGSADGQREPHVYFTAEHASAPWQGRPIERGFGGCGLYAFEWEKDVVQLKPGEKLLVTNEGMGNPIHMFRYAGRVRVVGHYDYTAKLGWADGERRGGMGNTPFTLTSNPVEFDVIYPLDLRIKVKQPLKVGVESKVSDIIEVTLTNTTDQPVTVASPTHASDGKLAVWGGDNVIATNPFITRHATPNGIAVELQPGETAVLLGAGELANGADGRFKGLKPGKVTIRVEYTTTTWNRGAAVDAWGEVTVVD